MSNTSDAPKTMEQAMAEQTVPKIPRDRYTLKIRQAEIKVGQTGDKNKYIECGCELTDNPPVIIDGEEVDINGVTGVKRFFLTEKSLNRLGKLHKQLGLPLNFTLNQLLESPNTSMYVGGKFNAIVMTTLEAQKKENGAPLLDSDGNQIIYRRIDIGDVV